VSFPTAPRLRSVVASVLYRASSESRGEQDEAARRFLAAYPHFSTAAWAKTQPFRDASALKHFVEGYRKAGLPE
jgi:hypothetical protein